MGVLPGSKSQYDERSRAQARVYGPSEADALPNPRGSTRPVEQESRPTHRRVLRTPDPMPPPSHAPIMPPVAPTQPGVERSPATPPRGTKRKAAQNIEHSVSQWGIRPTKQARAGFDALTDITGLSASSCVSFVGGIIGWIINRVNSSRRKG